LQTRRRTRRDPSPARSSKVGGDPDGSRSNLNLAIPTVQIDLVAPFDVFTAKSYERPNPNPSVL